MGKQTKMNFGVRMCDVGQSPEKSTWCLRPKDFRILYPLTHHPPQYTHTHTHTLLLPTAKPQTPHLPERNHSTTKILKVCGCRWTPGAGRERSNSAELCLHSLPLFFFLVSAVSLPPALLASKPVDGSALPFQSVHHVEGGHGLAA